MELTGQFSDRVDNLLGLPYHLLDQLSIREQRLVVKQRVQQIVHGKNKLVNQNKVPLTRPMDTVTNSMMNELKVSKQRVPVTGKGKVFSVDASTNEQASTTAGGPLTSKN